MGPHRSHPGRLSKIKGFGRWTPSKDDGKITFEHTSTFYFLDKEISLPFADRATPKPKPTACTNILHRRQPNPT